MKVLTGCLLASFFILVCAHLKAQNKGPGIQGTVYIENNIPADAASIILLRQADSSAVATLVTSKNGAFNFERLAPGNYRVMIKRVGYQRFYSSVIVYLKDQFHVPDIHLAASVISLNEVTIIDRKKYIDIRSDKTVLNVEKGVVATGTSALDILSSAPGVRIGNDGEVKYKGGQKALVMINGKPTYLATQDLANQLGNLQGGDIESIELIANPSAKYDAGGTGGVINIILKKGKNVGLNGSLNAGAGYGNFFKYNGGGTINYRNKQFNAFANASFLEGTVDHTIDIDRTVNSFGNSSQFNYRYYNSQKTSSPAYRFGADFFVDSLHTIGFLIYGNHIHSFLDKNTMTDVLNQNVRDSTLNTVAGLTREITTINYNINYSGSIGSNNRQQLSADADYSKYDRNSLEYITGNFYDATSNTNRTPYQFRSTVPTTITISSFRVDYVNNLTSKQKIEAGVKTSYVNSDNDQYFDKLVNNSYVSDPYFSSHFGIKDYINYGYLSYSKKGKVFDYNAGLRTEVTSSDATSSTAEDNVVNRNYVDWFPQATITYKYGTEGSRISLNYNRRIDRPSYEDLNPIIAYQDKYDYRAGNAFLRPSYQDNIQLTHTYLAKYVTSLYFLKVDNFYNFNYFSQNDITKVYTTTKINLKRMYTYGLNFNAPIEVTDWWNANLNVDASYQRFLDYSGNLNMNTTDVIVKLNQDFTVNKDLTANVKGYYETPTFYGITSLKSSYYASAGFSKKMLHQAGTLSVTLDDIFNTHRDRYTSNFINLNVLGYDKKETRIGRISFIYRFGKKTVKAARAHDAGNSAEKSRIGGY